LSKYSSGIPHNGILAINFLKVSFLRHSRFLPKHPTTMSKILKQKLSTIIIALKCNRHIDLKINNSQIYIHEYYQDIILNEYHFDCFYSALHVAEKRAAAQANGGSG
jgi:hypothetical protein